MNRNIDTIPLQNRGKHSNTPQSNNPHREYTDTTNATTQRLSEDMLLLLAASAMARNEVGSCRYRQDQYETALCKYLLVNSDHRPLNRVTRFLVLSSNFKSDLHCKVIEVFVFQSNVFFLLILSCEIL